MTAIYININITIHSALMVTRHDKTYVVVSITVTSNTAVVAIIKCSVDVDIDGTLDWHVWCADDALTIIGILTVGGTYY